MPAKALEIVKNTPIVASFILLLMITLYANGAQQCKENLRFNRRVKLKKGGNLVLKRLLM